MKHIALVIVVAVALVSVPAVQARPHGPGFGSPDPEVRLERWTERLDLTEGQRDELREIFARQRQALEAGRDAMRAARQTLGERIHADNFDEPAVREAAAAVAALQADRAVARARLVQRIRGVLSPEQYDELEEMREQRRERFEARSRDHRPHRHHRRPW